MVSFGTSVLLAKMGWMAVDMVVALPVSVVIVMAVSYLTRHETQTALQVIDFVALSGARIACESVLKMVG